MTTEITTETHDSVPTDRAAHDRPPDRPPDRHLDGRSDGSSGADAQEHAVADAADRAVSENPALVSSTRLGWIAKGVVYFLMGGTAISIAQQEPTDDDASPAGALDRVMEQPGGRVLLGVLAVGLILYAVWRLLSVAVIRGNGWSCWADRIGYSASAAFYTVLAFVAARSVVDGREQGESNTIERVSRSSMEMAWGRWLVLVGGVITIAVGVFFVVKKGLMRSFTDDLRGVGDAAAADDAVDHVLIAAGVAGWIGRGIVTILVGFFLCRAAIRFDPDDATGFDGALRNIATTSAGTALVRCAAIGLITYGAFCLLSHTRRRLEDNS